MTVLVVGFKKISVQTVFVRSQYSKTRNVSHSYNNISNYQKWEDLLYPSCVFYSLCNMIAGVNIPLICCCSKTFSALDPAKDQKWLCLPVCLSVCLFFVPSCLLFCQPTSPSVCLSVSLSVFLSVLLNVVVNHY